jgi:DNA-binding NarL/FixJ family response regulator
VKSISIMLVDEVPEARAVLRLGLEAERDLRVVAEVAASKEASRVAAAVHPHAVLVVVSGAGSPAIRTIEGLRHAAPRAGVGVLLDLGAAQVRSRALDAGADWCLARGAPMRLLRSQLRVVAREPPILPMGDGATRGATRILPGLAIGAISRGKIGAGPKHAS